jgi:MYXO-CTERM domain-containing protein
MKKTTVAMMFAANLSLLGAGVARAETGWQPQTFKVAASDPKDTARVQNGRLQKTRYEESNEQAVVKLFGDGKTGLFVQMQSASLNGTAPKDRQNAACYPFSLTQNTDGSVTAMSTGAGKFVTDNTGQDYRNANKPEIIPVNGGKNMLLMFNYRPQGANNTVRWAKVLDASCNEVPVQDSTGKVQTQVQIMAKTNDDCDMHQSGEGPGEVYADANGSTDVVLWAGCNGNGKDDGWVNSVNVKSVNSGAAFQITKNFDVDVEPNEERTRGRCSVADADPNTAICTWTAGNNQPQRDGTWIGAVDLSPSGAKGENANSRLLWKKMIEGQKSVQGVRTYSVRANSSRILTENADGTVSKSNMLFVQTSDLRGNNTNDRKGGRYLQMNLAVAQADKTGLTWVVPPTDVTNMMLGIDATHLTEAFTMVQDGAKTLPAMSFLQGSQNGGGGAPADIKVLALDSTAKKFVDYGTHPAGGTYDRHLYSNYLGGNPGNQGRNFAGAITVLNPFVGQNGSTAKYLLMHAITGKDPADVANPALKQSSYISIVPVLNPQTTPAPAAGQPNTAQVGQNMSGGGQNSAPQAGDPPVANEMPPASSGATGSTSASMGSFSSGCSMGGSSTSGQGVFFLLAGLGLVVLVRRRRA